MGKTLLLTGASSGFGKATAKLFQSKGWNVIATMRSPNREEELKDLENVLVLKLDVTDVQTIGAAVKAGVEKFGSIDVLVNNAGYALMGAFESVTADQVEKQYAVNVFGLMNVTQAVLPLMRERKKGTIINISSFGGVVGGPFASVYNSSKFAVEGFSESLSHELAFLNIAVKIIEPGGVLTNFRNNILWGSNSIGEYNRQLATLMSIHMQRVSHLKHASIEEVADTIFQAATDGLFKLRYVVGEDSQFYIEMKTKNSEADYLRAMRS